MGVVVKLIEAILFLFFLVISLSAPLLDAQTCLPSTFFPDFLVRFSTWYAKDFNDFLVIEKPHFFVGLIWLELLFQWPLVLLNLYGMLTCKPWFKTTCLIYGVSASTAMIAVLSEMKGTNKASKKLLMVYLPFMGMGILATLRGLLAYSFETTSTIDKEPAMARKKRV